MAETPISQLHGGKLARMVRWYDPRLLARVGVRTIVSSVFGQYADQRIVQAATDSVSIPDLKVRYDYSDPNSPHLHRRVPLDEKGAVWVDYIADTGDGFESTYTMAYLLAQHQLSISEDGKNARDIKAGSILIMGGDQCYPQATREDYKKKLVTPFSWAFDVPEPQRRLFAIPGNHDWYDGLAAFDSLFCSSRDPLNEAQARGTRMGGWQCQQHRSYWAMKLPYNWWIWGTDIQFSKYLDVSQVSYFEMMANEMRPGDNLIICMAEPSWMLSDFQGQDEEENFYKITTIARQAGVRIRAIVAGDWHHYARYYSPEHDVHFITAGGGGSFLHPTHVLKDQIKIEWPEPDSDPNATAGAPDVLGPPPPPGWHKSTTDIRLGNKTPDKPTPVGDAVNAAKEVGAVLEEAVKPIQGVLKRRKARPRILQQSAPKVYPEKSRSRLLSLRNLLFPFYNMPFAIGIGLVYWLITWEFYSVVERHDISAGKIDAVGVHTDYFALIPFMPLYLIQALLVSIPLAAMMGALLVCLIWYVEAGERTGWRKNLRKGFIGTAHFSAHVFTMFSLGLAFVMVNNWVAPRVEPQVNALWKSFGSDKSTVAGRVVKEAFEPLSESRQAQRDMFGGNEQGTLRRSAPPAAAMPDGEVKPADTQLLTKSVRQVVGFILYPLQIIGLGGVVGGLVWGLYWTLSSVFLRMHAEDAFAALRIKHYKNFLRLRIDQNGLTIYPVGVDRVPTWRFWVARDKAKAVPLNNPALVARRRIPVRLIEAPIVIPND